MRSIVIDEGVRETLCTACARECVCEMAISTRWAIVVSVIYTEKLVVFIGRAGQTVSLPIAFGVIFFFFITLILFF